MAGRSTPSTLHEIIADVRRRWRLKLALRGATRVLGVVLVLFLVAAYGMEWARFSPASIIASRVIFALALVGSFYLFLFVPLRRKVSDEQVAMYLEEHEPSLQATLLSAVEASRGGTGAESTALVRKVIEQAVEACAQHDAVRRLEQTPLRQHGAAVAAIAAVALLSVLVGPAFIRSALSALLLLDGSIQAATPYRITVTPGNTSVPKGSDQTIKATLQGFATEGAVLMARRTPTAGFESLPLAQNEDGSWEGLIFDIASPLDYFVEAEGVRSPVFTMKVVEVPYVQRLELEYHFPAYTGLEPQKIEDGGDIAVLAGTDVRLRIFPTMKAPNGRLLVDEKTTVALAPQPDGSLTASFKAAQDGFYRVELQAPSGEFVVASPQYTVDVLEDQAPTISFSRPGRDTSASAIEEVFVEAQAEDDYGVRNLELVFSVNGGPEKVVKLFAGARRLSEVTAGHTFYLEELGVAAGDSVSYYARATDNDGVAGAKQATSDLYFVRVRPFSRDFRQAQSQGGGGGGGGGGGQVEALSEQQRQIIAATFNVQRDRRKLTAAKLRENSTVVSLSQSALREQVEGLLTRMNSQLVQQDPAFAKIAELLPQAVTAMKEAEGKLSAAAPDAALPPENKALQILQKAEEEYELQVSAGQQAGGGGGGGGGAMQQELADIFEQELDKMASRYETSNQASEQSADREVDELLEKLKELARRQQQEAERQRRRALEGQMAGGGSGAQQRALAEQVEEAARRLERLAREEQKPEMAEAARQMREAADAMRRAAAGGDANASAQAQQALERLQETERRLQRSLTDRAEREIQDARRAADEIAREQQQIADATRNLPAQGGAGRAQQARQINERKNTLEEKLGKLEGQLDRAARDSANDEKAASRKMAEAAGAIRDNRLRDRIRYSQNLVSRGNEKSIADAEGDISRGIEEMRDRLEEAQQALGQGAPGDRREQAVDRAQRLARGAESLSRRTQERGQQGQQGREGQQGQNGQQGEQGKQGEQGQRGQQGQQGQQGQGQQGQGGQQGQQGQDGQQAQGGQGGGGRNDGQRGDARNGDLNGGFDRGGARAGDAAWGGWWDGGPFRLSEEDVRQLRNEVRQYAGEARELRNMLRGENIDPKELDEIVAALRQLEDPRVYQNVAELSRLQAFVAEGFKRFEFGLRRELDADRNALVLSGKSEVPEEYRKAVEEYYRSLGRTPR
jgi:hypothetical protein